MNLTHSTIQAVPFVNSINTVILMPRLPIDNIAVFVQVNTLCHSHVCHFFLSFQEFYRKKDFFYHYLS